MTSVERVVSRRRVSYPDEPWQYWVTHPVAERLEAVENPDANITGGPMELNPDFQELLQLFIDHDVRDLADAAELPPEGGE